MEMNNKRLAVEEKNAKSASGLFMLIFLFIGVILTILGMVAGGVIMERGHLGFGTFVLIASICLMIIVFIMFAGLRAVNPNEAVVLVLFGNYYGTLDKPGYYWVNPFCSSVNPLSKSSATVTGNITAGTGSTGGRGKISLKTCTLENQKQKVNDELGNPIEIGTIVIWQVENATKAVFNIENYQAYISTQCDAVTRNVARCYPYDTSEGNDEWSLRGSSQEIAELMKKELQDKVVIAGIAIQDVRITHLAYAPEIASAMLQRQQAVAVIDARQKIVEGAVSMVEMALSKLSENQVVELDEERKAAMVSNLLVVLCGNKDVQPIVNSGSIY